VWRQTLKQSGVRSQTEASFCRERQLLIHLYTKLGATLLCGHQFRHVVLLGVSTLASSGSLALLYDQCAGFEGIRNLFSMAHDAVSHGT